MATVTVGDANGCPTVVLPPIVRGDNYSRQFTLYQSDGTTVLDITGRTYGSSWATEWTATPTVVATVTVTDAANGVLIVSMTPTQTTALSASAYVGDLVENPGLSSERTLMRFRVLMIEGVT